jgi:lipopolysaccharide/colanic/teichoic acid biosynthesis glycosyltransferase
MISYHPHIKRLLDIILSLTALMLLFPFFVLISLLICLESKGSPFFMHDRIGKGMLVFRLIKFRTMTTVDTSATPQFEPGEKSRVTKVGNVLRSTKIDELPELINVLKGDMSIVGPRPEVSTYVQFYPEAFKAILHVRPGLSDYASIKFRNEEEILACQPDPEHYYRHVILPDKLRLAKHYTEEVSFRTDFRIIVETLKRIMGRNVR